ncbi:MAG: hypothetical protein ACR2QF_02855 [Geminicoccaceae bacterium]
MTKPSSMSANQKTIGLSDRPYAGFRHDQHPSVTDEEPYQPLITAAILTTTAFRMRDNTALIEALRMLVRAVEPFESDSSEQAKRLER